MLAFGMPGMGEWLVILVIILIVFGAGKLPQVMSQAGKGIKAFKDGAEGKEEDSDESPKAGTTPAQLTDGGTDELEETESMPEKSKKKSE